MGLVHALHLMRGERVSPGHLAEEACEVEINRLGNPIGKQDQYAAAFGGLNHIVFKKNGRVEIDHLVLPGDLIDRLFENSLLIWSGIQRDASSILYKQNQGLSSKIERYKALKLDVVDCKEMFLNPPADMLQRFGALLDRTWMTKKGLEGSISSSEINEIHDQVKAMGGHGGKLSGAGGGGFLFEMIPSALHPELLACYGASVVLKVSYEPLGSRILSEVM